jgi:hypothetical protein
VHGVGDLDLDVEVPDAVLAVYLQSKGWGVTAP